MILLAAVASPAAGNKAASTTPPGDAVRVSVQVIAAQEAIDQPAAEPAAQADSGAKWPSFNPSFIILPIVTVAVLVVFFGLGTYRLREAPERPAGISPPLGFVLFLAMLVLESIGAMCGRAWLGVPAAAAQASPGGSEPLPLTLEQMARLTLLMYAFAAPVVIAFFVLRSRPPRPAPDRRWSAAKALGLGALALVIALPVVITAADLAMWFAGEPADPIAHETLRMLVGGELDFAHVAMALLVVFAAPVIEEVAHRGLVQTALVQAGLPRWPAILFAAAAFAAMHWSVVPPPALAALFVLGIALGWSYEKTGRLIAPIMLHMLFNAANLGIALALS